MWISGITGIGEVRAASCRSQVAGYKLQVGIYRFMIGAKMRLFLWGESKQKNDTKLSIPLFRRAGLLKTQNAKDRGTKT